MRKLFALLLLVTLSFASSSDLEVLKVKFNEEISILKPVEGVNTSDIITQVNSRSSFTSHIVDLSKVEEQLAATTLPSSIIAIIKDKIKQDCSHWESFSMTSFNDETIESYIGALRILDGKVEYVVMSVNANGSVKQQFEHVTEKKCKSPLQTDCSEVIVARPVQLQINQIKEVHTVLRQKAFEEMNKLFHNSQFNFELFLDGIPVDNAETVDLTHQALLKAVGAPYKTLYFLPAEDDDDPQPEPDPDPKHPDPAPEDDKKKPDAGDSIGKIIGAITKGANAWSQIASAFKTTCSEKIKERIAGKGFEQFSNNSQLQITRGLKAEFLDRFLVRLTERVQVPTDKQKAFKDVLEEVTWGDSTVWSALETVFNVEATDRVKAVNFWINRNEVTDKYDFIYTDVKASFSLAPDIIIMAKSKSIAGGIFEDYKEHEITKKRSLTDEDVKSVLTFFQVVAFKSFCDQFNIKVEFPQ